MADDSKEHTLDVETGAHIDKGGGDAGACLTRHIGAYDDTTPCSHRWQGYRTAEENSTWYNGPAYDSLLNHPKKTWRPSSSTAWDLNQSSTVWRTKDGVTTQRTVPNFRELASVPYAHNSHHIIPNGVFNGELLAVAKNDMRTFWLVRVKMLEAKYNLNHKINVVILPMRRYVGKAIGLPRHISGVDSLPSDSPECRNHTKYNDKVRKRVAQIIQDFAKSISLKEHDVEAGEFAKTALENYSTSVMTRLRAWATTARGAAGAAINRAPASVFGG